MTMVSSTTSQTTAFPKPTSTGGSYDTHGYYTDDRGHGLSIGQKILIGIGVPLVVIFLAMLGVLYWYTLKKTRMAEAANAGQEMAPTVGERGPATNAPNTRAMGAAAPTYPVGVIREPEPFNYNEYGGYYADTVVPGGGWYGTGKGAATTTTAAQP
jgi:hypothetical protein